MGSIKLSIITIVYNGEALLEGTIQSVIQQTYPNIEYFIVDGASTDGTLAIIRKYETNITKWVSEKDKGLYDAMNKGIGMATGDYIWFMNCGDHIYSKDTVEKMMILNTGPADVIYGEVMMVNEDRSHLGTRSELSTRKLPDQLSWKSLKNGMVVSHQAFIPNRVIAPLYIENNLAADIDWVIHCLKKSKSVLNTKMILAEYLVGGLSKQRHFESLKNRYRVLQKHYGVFPNFLNHIYITFRAVVFTIKGIFNRNNK